MPFLFPDRQNVMSSRFENIFNDDIARNFQMELQYEDIPLYWDIDPEDNIGDMQLKARRAEYYLTKHIRP